MNKGSKRITIRVGDEMLELIDEYLETRLGSSTSERWTRTDFVMQAIAEKLSHSRRSRRQAAQVKQRKIDPYRPREVTDE